MSTASRTRLLAELTVGVPDARVVGAAEVADRARRSARVLVVLDDDPTGTQSVADLPVLLTWEVEALRWALQQGRPALYVMTNSRSLSAADAEQRNREVARNALAAAAETGTEVAFVSRSDSTLRGHFPLETDALAAEVDAAGGTPVTGVVIVPAFGDAGRVTVGGVHWASVGGTGPDTAYVPVGETEFARDATFGYVASDLREWVAEKTDGRVPADQVATVDLTTLRTSPEAVVATLTGLRDGRPVVVDIVDETDLRLLALAVWDAEDAGARLLFRCGPPLPRALIGQEPHLPLEPAELAAIRAGGLAEDAVGGLVVVGSHVDLTTRQLTALMERRASERLELDVERVLADGPDAYAAELAERAAALLATTDVVISTSRRLVTAESKDESLAIARQVSTAVVTTVAAVLARRSPRFVVAKGGITSSDVAARGLGIGRAMVRGPMLPGLVSLWEPVDGPARGIPYVVFAGNVGGPESLADVVDKLSGIRATDERNAP